MMGKFMLICAIIVSSQFCKTVKTPKRDFKNRTLSTSIDRNTGWDKLRFYVDWSELTVEEKIKYEKYIDAAFIYFSNALKVHQIISKSIWDDFFYETSDCKGLIGKYSGKEIKDTDMLVLLTVEYNSEETYAGYSVNCAIDPVTNQPIATVINLNKARIGTGNDDIEKLIMLVTHELAHSLGFNYDDISNFIKADGSKYSETELFTTLKIRGLEDQVFLSTPKVQELAREAFGCSTLPGIQLENQGGEGSIYQHWDKRMMGTEYMNPQMLRNGIVYSDLTLAVFEDSGWYQSDYSYGTKINFGYKKGCDFIEEKCIIEEQTTSEEFCSDGSLMKCDFSHLSYGFCKFVEDFEIPSEFQYFSDDTLGGDFYSDYCPINLRTIGCRGNSYNPNNHLGENFCIDCRCVEGTFSLNVNDDYRGSCHEITCYDSSFDVKVGNITVTCTVDGEELNVEGYFGSLICPKFEKICNYSPCRLNCYGEKCENGKCVNGGDQDGFVAEDYPDYGGTSLESSESLDSESSESFDSESLESSSSESSESYSILTTVNKADIFLFCLAYLILGI